MPIQACSLYSTNMNSKLVSFLAFIGIIQLSNCAAIPSFKEIKLLSTSKVPFANISLSELLNDVRVDTLNTFMKTLPGVEAKKMDEFTNALKKFRDYVSLEDQIDAVVELLYLGAHDKDSNFTRTEWKILFENKILALSKDELKEFEMELSKLLTVEKTQIIMPIMNRLRKGAESDEIGTAVAKSMKIASETTTGMTEMEIKAFRDKHPDYSISLKTPT